MNYNTDERYEDDARILTADEDPTPMHNPAATIPLVLPVVRTPDGHIGVVLREAACGFQRVEVFWWDARLWQPRKYWYDVGALVTLGYANAS